MSTINVTNETLAALNFFAVQAPIHFLWFIGGFFGFVCNTLVIMTIVKSKDLHSTSHFLITSLSFGDALLGLTYCLTGLKRYILYLSLSLDLISQLKCLLQCLPLPMLSLVTLNLTLMLSLDRVILIAKPMYYRKLNPKRYITIMNFVSWSTSTFIVIFIFYDNDYQRVLLVCTPATSINPMYHLASAYINNTIQFATAAFSAISLIILVYKMRKDKKLSVLQNETQRNLDTKTRASFTITAILCVNILQWIGGLFCNFVISSYFDPTYVVRTAPYIGVIGVFYILSPFIIYLVMSRIFRSAFLKIIFAKNATPVHPLELTQRVP